MILNGRLSEQQFKAKSTIKAWLYFANFQNLFEFMQFLQSYSTHLQFKSCIWFHSSYESLTNSNKKFF